MTAVGCGLLRRVPAPRELLRQADEDRRDALDLGVDAQVADATGHAEVVQVEYDPAVVSYQDLLNVFFTIHDPTQLNRQGNDVGTQYRSGIYFTTPEQEAEAQAIIAELTKDNAFGRSIVTEVLALDNYWPAEPYHQDFFEKNPNQGYCVAVAGPKVAKFRKTFRDLVKD